MRKGCNFALAFERQGKRTTKELKSSKKVTKNFASSKKGCNFAVALRLKL